MHFLKVVTSIKDKEIKTRESEWISKSTQLVSNGAGIQTQRQSSFLIYTLSGEYSLPLELPEVKRKYSFDFETSQAPSCHCIPYTKEYGIHIAFKWGGGRGGISLY